MAHTVSGELREDAKKFSGQNSNGQWDGYEVRLSEVIRDRKSGEKKYTNYKAVFFASSEKMSAYLADVLVAGRSLTLAASKLSVDIFQKQDGSQSVSLVMENPTIDWASFSTNNNANASQNSNASSNNSGWGKPQQSSPKSDNSKKPNPDTNFDDDIPF